MRSIPLALGPLLCALSIVAGAFGAHALRTRIEPGALELWETAARYLMYAGFGLTLLVLAADRWGRAVPSAAGWILFTGSLVFSGTLAALALGAPRWLGAVTPVGGLLMILGFLLFAWTSLRL